MTESTTCEYVKDGRVVIVKGPGMAELLHVLALDRYSLVDVLAWENSLGDVVFEFVSAHRGLGALPPLVNLSGKGRRARVRNANPWSKEPKGTRTHKARREKAFETTWRRVK